MKKILIASKSMNHMLWWCELMTTALSDNIGGSRVSWICGEGPRVNTSHQFYYPSWCICKPFIRVVRSPIVISLKKWIIKNMFVIIVGLSIRGFFLNFLILDSLLKTFIFVITHVSSTWFVPNDSISQVLKH